MASLALEIWLAIDSGGMVVMLGCSHVWLATSMPASAMRLAPAGFAATLLPIRKNVDLASLSCRILSSRSVYGLGPSSNVSATHLTCEQSTLSAPALRMWPVSPPTTRTVAAASTPMTVRQYLQAWLSGRFGTLAAYLVVICARFVTLTVSATKGAQIAQGRAPGLISSSISVTSAAIG